MNQGEDHRNFKISPPRRSLKFALLCGAIFGAWALMPFDPSLNKTPPALTPDDIGSVIKELSSENLKKEHQLSFSKSQRSLAKFGQKLFFDPSFSANGKVSCASCHKPDQAFSDGLVTAKGLSIGPRRTPDIRNTFAQNWFFWDGRADSLASQALGPIENPGEHGISRTHTVALIKEHYLDEYVENFGEWPKSLTRELPTHAMPNGKKNSLSAKIKAYTLASLNSFPIQDAILEYSRAQRISPAAAVGQLSLQEAQPPKAWVEAWKALPHSVQRDINIVFSRFGLAIAQFEQGLISIDSPFDQFASRFQKLGSLEQSLSKSFGEEELAGLRIFTGAGECIACHSGPMFMDHQFHNIGLPLKLDPRTFLEKSPAIDIGRSLGIEKARQDQFNCKGDYLNKDSESCRELDWLTVDNLEFVGSFKTPSLRNIAQRAPYMHDGRFKSLEEAIQHYNELPEKAGIGHREETLRQLKLNKKQTTELIAFLHALSSPTLDLSQ